MMLTGTGAELTVTLSNLFCATTGNSYSPRGQLRTAAARGTPGWEEAFDSKGSPGLVEYPLAIGMSPLTGRQGLLTGDLNVMTRVYHQIHCLYRVDVEDKKRHLAGGKKVKPH